MPEPLLHDRLRTALYRLTKQAAERSRAEVELENAQQSRQQAIVREFQQAQKRIEHQLTATQSAAIKEYQDRMQAITSRFENEHAARSREFSAQKLKINTTCETDKEKLESEFKDARWTITTIYEADRKVAKDQLINIQRQVGNAIQRLDECHDQALQLAKSWQLLDLVPDITARPLEASEHPDALAGVKDRLATGEATLRQMKQEVIPSYANGLRLPLLCVLAWLVLLLPTPFMSEWYYWVAASTVGMTTISLTLHVWLKASLRRRFIRYYQTIQQAVADAAVFQKRCLDEATSSFHEVVDQARRRQDQALEQATEKYRQAMLERTQRHARELAQAETKFLPLLEELEQQRDQDLKQAEARYQKLMAASTLRYDADLREATEKRDQALAALQREIETRWQTLTEQWHKALADFRAEVEDITQRCRQLFPSWDDPVWDNWPAAPSVPAGLPIGTLELRPELIPHGVPKSEKLRALTPPGCVLPALLPFPAKGSLLLRASEEGRAVGIQALQALMLRALTALPPAKVRFTILDPVGLGENFAAFAHLADHDDALISGKIWTEVGQIEQQLANLTEQIENIIQKYLRNQFETLEEYNAEAGEVAEPYRFLVVAHFPSGFTDEAARRLLSIAASGARCGIQTLVLQDTRLPLPQYFDLRDLELVSTVLVWKDKRFVWQDSDLQRLPLRLATPPGDEMITRLLKTVGERAVAASRVEVPFRVVAPRPEEWWTGDTRDGIRVALGRAGATRKQYLALGEGTAQHVLVAGKTGSGKSTLLHALITQLALHYSPDEVELYLVDFKKGVEFKTYATYELPHARVIAIESEREFGLSVLQRLDTELKQRGDLFRQVGAHDLAGAREALAAASLPSDGRGAGGEGMSPPPQPSPLAGEGVASPLSPGGRGVGGEGNARPQTAIRLPRVLLIVDEFQEFFVEDDRIAQDAALLLDRLVRQGRAFGIHILLGSQTLGGAYSLARSTIDQMAVRIALQCSEADGHLILGKDNPAARLLARPGEAIYNDANGLVEANSLFQTVWLSEGTREELLRQVQELAWNRGLPPPVQVVFEGNAVAVLSKNHLLQQLLDAPAPPPASAPCVAWLGEAIAIKDPTAAVFRRRGGSNLLLLGQHGEGALGILNAALLSLAAGLPIETGGNGQRPRFYLLIDPSGDEGPLRWFQRLAELLPQAIQLVSWRDLPVVLAELASEVDRRTQQRDAEAPMQFLFIHGLQSFRDLRRQDDDFGFSRRSDDKPMHPSKHFATIYRDGPPVGIHTLAWCDTLTNVQRFLDRQALREFEMRVLFQMSAADSSNLIDSPLASKLGLYRALFCSEDEGRLEKFRPYGLPEVEWLESVRGKLTRMCSAV